MKISKQEQSASQWVHDYSDLLYSFAVQRVRDDHLAKDLVQETFLAAWRNVDNYSGEASVKTWLFTILKNKIIDHYRKASTRLSGDLHSIETAPDVFFDDADHWDKDVYPADWGVDYSSKIESKEFFTVLDKCRGRLKEIQNAAFSMKYLEGYNSDEICKVLQISSSNYWVLVHRAKTQLRACLEKNWFVR
jgi:RNA polymerase sigma-70 factor (TIGR02943 family)